MPLKGRRRCRSLPHDILGNLPDNIIDVILMRLPCKDAMRTSILLKKWRYHWRRLTESTLDQSHWSTKEDLLDPTVKFSKIVYQLLTLYEGPITKFTLDIVRLRSCPEIDFFIYFLSRNGIQHLAFHLPGNEDEAYKLSSLFTCSQLRHLTLDNCLIHPPSRFQGFDRLITLELCCISNNCLTNVPLLTKVSSNLYEGSSMEAQNVYFVKFFESCFALEHLQVYFIFEEFEYVKVDEAPLRLPFDRSRVKQFYVCDIMLEDSYETLCCFSLLRSLPYLEYLELKICSEDEWGPTEFLELERFSDVTFNHLSEVKLEDFYGRTPQMQLLKLLLAKSPVLVRVIMDSSLYPKRRSKILANVSTFWHASPKVEVIYHDLRSRSIFEVVVE